LRLDKFHFSCCAAGGSSRPRYRLGFGQLRIIEGRSKPNLGIVRAVTRTSPLRALRGFLRMGSG
jgi:hypothetical protein